MTYDVTAAPDANNDNLIDGRSQAWPSAAHYSRVSADPVVLTRSCRARSADRLSRRSRERLRRRCDTPAWYRRSTDPGRRQTVGLDRVGPEPEQPAARHHLAPNLQVAWQASGSFRRQRHGRRRADRRRRHGPHRRVPGDCDNSPLSIFDAAQWAYVGDDGYAARWASRNQQLQPHWPEDCRSDVGAGRKDPHRFWPAGYCQPQQDSEGVLAIIEPPPEWTPMVPPPTLVEEVDSVGASTWFDRFHYRHLVVRPPLAEQSCRCKT